MDIEVDGNLQKLEIRDSCQPNCEVQGTYQRPRLIARGKTYEKKGERQKSYKIQALLLRATQRGFQQNGKLIIHHSHGEHS